MKQTNFIETPKGRIVQGPNGKAQLIWNTAYVPKWNGLYNGVQRFIDSEVLTQCEKYTPLRTSMLIKSGTLGTDIGSGVVQWIAPYAKGQYYRGRLPGTSDTGPLRGRFWFQRMKVNHGHSIIKKAKSIVRRGLQ
jgi:hypothetical protein